MAEKMKLETESCIIIDENNSLLFDDLTDEQREEYTKKIMERAGSILRQYLSDNHQEAESLYERENM